LTKAWVNVDEAEVVVCAVSNCCPAAEQPTSPYGGGIAGSAAVRLRVQVALTEWSLLIDMPPLLSYILTARTPFVTVDQLTGLRR
jgi:hypothetical protein